MEELKQAASRAAQVSEAGLTNKARAVEDTLKQARQSELKRLQLKSVQLAQEIDQIAEDAHDFSLEFGQAGRLSAGERLELGRRLARNRKIAELARMVGRFKQRRAGAAPQEPRPRARARSTTLNAARSWPG